MTKLLELFYTFFLIGLLTIGGGYAMIPMIQDNAVSRGWLTMEEVLNFFAIAESTPGPFAVNTATLVGFSQMVNMPIIGAIVTTTAVVMPSFIIILVIAKNFHVFLENKWIQMALTAIKAVVVGMIFAVVAKLIYNNVVIISESEPMRFDYKAVIIIVIILITSRFFKKIGPIPLIILSGILGYLLYGLL